MISFEEAQRITLNTARKLHHEEAELSKALGKILAHVVVSDMDMQ